jgi:hypothetical protein
MTPVTTQAQEARDPLGHAEIGTNPAKSYKSCQKFLLGTCGNAMRPALWGISPGVVQVSGEAKELVSTTKDLGALCLLDIRGDYWQNACRLSVPGVLP